MKKFLFYILFSILIIGSQAQENYVTTDILNMREGAGNEYAVTGRLPKGDTILVYEISNGWAKIKTGEEQYKYVDSNFLKSTTSSENINVKEKSEPAKKRSYWWVVILVSIIFLFIIISRYNRRCRSCKKWNSMKKLRRERVGQKSSSVKEKRYIKDRKGKILATTEVDVPATIYYYRTHRKCKHCGYEDYTEQSEKIKN